MQFYISILFLLLTWSSWIFPTFASHNWAAEVGNPIYVLEQFIDDSKKTHFSVWEIRAAETNRMLFSGSRRLVTGSGLTASSFGLFGFQIDSGRIDPGTLVVLDSNGRLWINYDTRMNPFGEGYQSLEEGAESSLFAITRLGNLVEIKPQNNAGIPDITPVASFENFDIHPGEVITDVYHGEEGIRRLVTDNGRTLDWSAHRSAIAETRDLPKELAGIRPGKVRLFDGILWVVANNTLFRHELSTKKSHSIDLNSLYQNQKGGHTIQFLGFQDGSVYAKIGNHVGVFWAATGNSTLSYRIIADEFFAARIRPYGINYDLFTDVIAMQPRLAERNGLIRRDVVVRNFELKPIEKSGKSYEYEWRNMPGILEFYTPGPTDFTNWQQYSPFAVLPKEVYEVLKHVIGHTDGCKDLLEKDEESIQSIEDIKAKTAADNEYK